MSLFTRQPLREKEQEELLNKIISEIRKYLVKNGINQDISQVVMKVVLGTLKDEITSRYILAQLRVIVFPMIDNYTSDKNEREIILKKLVAKTLPILKATIESSIQK